MKNPLLKMKKDKTAEKEGVWIEYMPTVDANGEDAMIRFRLRRAGGTNIEFLSEMELRQKPYRLQMKANGGQLDNETMLKISKAVFCEFLLVDWENVQNPETDEFVSFSAEEAHLLFDYLPDVFQELLLECQSGDLFAVRDADSKN